METAVFGGGCFWCTEAVYKMLKGVSAVAPGYTGGTVETPTYEQICTGTTGHAEVIKVDYDPKEVSYRDLLTIFFASHDPTTINRQGADVGTQYRSTVFYTTPEQKTAAKNTLTLLDKAKIFRDGIVTEVSPAAEFYAAEDYHQKYLKKNPMGYCHIQLQSSKIAEILKSARSNK